VDKVLSVDEIASLSHLATEGAAELTAGGTPSA
jgi:hypothetical protein